LAETPGGQKPKNDFLCTKKENPIRKKKKIKPDLGGYLHVMVMLLYIGGRKAGESKKERREKRNALLTRSCTSATVLLDGELKEERRKIGALLKSEPAFTRGIRRY